MKHGGSSVSLNPSVKCRGKNGDPSKACPDSPFLHRHFRHFSPHGPWSMKLCHGFSEEHAQLPFSDIWQEAIMQISLKRCHVRGWNNFIEPCGFLSSHSLGLHVRGLGEKKMKKLGHPKTFQKWSRCATRECKTGECLYPLPCGCWHHREHTLSLSLFDWNTSRKAVERDGNQLFFHLPYYWAVVPLLPFLLSEDLRWSFISSERKS